LFLAALGAFWTEPAAGALPTPVKPDDPWYPSSHAYYQLQDVSGRGGHTAAGSQWFATAIGYWDEAYRRDVCGGQAPGVAMIASADLVSGFDSVYLQGGAGFEPAESIALVLKEGSGILSLDFGNACRGSLGAEDATEDVLAVGLENDYRTRVEPGQPVLVASGDRLHTEINFQAQSQNYGSRPGYLTFRQSTRSGSESINIPLVVANVYDGLASDAGNELFFDITVFGGGNMEPVTRKNFAGGPETIIPRPSETFS
jgi:hypothetical protein